MQCLRVSLSRSIALLAVCQRELHFHCFITPADIGPTSTSLSLPLPLPLYLYIFVFSLSCHTHSLCTVTGNRTLNLTFLCSMLLYYLKKQVSLSLSLHSLSRLPFSLTSYSFSLSSFSFSSLSLFLSLSSIPTSLFSLPQTLSLFLSFSLTGIFFFRTKSAGPSLRFGVN